MIWLARGRSSQLGTMASALVPPTPRDRFSDIAPVRPQADTRSMRVNEQEPLLEVQSSDRAAPTAHHVEDVWSRLVRDAADAEQHKNRKPRQSGAFLDSEGGIRTHDLRVMRAFKRLN